MSVLEQIKTFALEIWTSNLDRECPMRLEAITLSKAAMVELIEETQIDRIPEQLELDTGRVKVALDVLQQKSIVFSVVVQTNSEEHAAS